MSSYTDILKSIDYESGLVVGFPEADLVAWENKNDIILPEALRNYYLTVGNSGFNQAHNRLYSPADLEIQDGFLLFMEENQFLVVWGIKQTELSQPDPQIHQGEVLEDEKNEWYPENKLCETFLNQMLLFQVCMGGFEFTGARNADEKTLDRLINTYKQSPFGDEDMVFLYDSGIVIGIFEDEIYAAAKTEELLKKCIGK